MLLRIEVFGDDIYLDDATTLGDELVTDLDPGLQEVHVQLWAINTHHLGDIFTFLFCASQFEKLVQFKFI